MRPGCFNAIISDLFRRHGTLMENERYYRILRLTLHVPYGTVFAIAAIIEEGPIE